MKLKNTGHLIDDFTFPDTCSVEFIDKFEELINEPKQRKKRKELLQKTLNKLCKFEEEFAIQVMDTTIDNDYQGIIFSDTNERYHNWLKKRNSNNSGQGVSFVPRKGRKQHHFL